ncbi:hypothetical protein [uncultured Flavobacterium sp.]|uniref:hypothetical protein n=1 Tax=uncultured Flavobacterium sp. TaxID=165435 RepID=UPI0025D6A244|nr:hypothetical protein [uncultured Flavobacterium sp.]
MKKILTLMLMLGGLNCFAQGQERFIGEAGIRVPLGNMADKVGPSPEFGLWFRTRMDESNDMLDVGISIHIPGKTHEFDYTTPDSLYRTKANGVSGMIGFRPTKVYTVGFDLSLEWVSTFGYAFMMYDDKEARYKHKAFPEEFEDSDNTSFIKAFSTFHIGQGIRLNYANVGMEVNYSYTPYGLFTNYVPRNFGSHSFSFGIVYRQ